MRAPDGLRVVVDHDTLGGRLDHVAIEWWWARCAERRRRRRLHGRRGEQRLEQTELRIGGHAGRCNNRVGHNHLRRWRFETERAVVDLEHVAHEERAVGRGAGLDGARHVLGEVVGLGDGGGPEENANTKGLGDRLHGDFVAPDLVARHFIAVVVPGETLSDENPLFQRLGTRLITEAIVAIGTHPGDDTRTDSHLVN
jgi:hypothetical protein